MADDDLWRKRFHLFALARLFGLTMIMLGFAIALTGLVREGGWPLLGGIIAVMGLIDAVFAPRLLKKMWEEEDRRRG